MQELIAQRVKQIKIDEKQAQGGAAVLFKAALQAFLPVRRRALR